MTMPNNHLAGLLALAALVLGGLSVQAAVSGGSLLWPVWGVFALLELHGAYITWTHQGGYVAASRQTNDKVSLFGLATLILGACSGWQSTPWTYLAVTFISLRHIGWNLRLTGWQVSSMIRALVGQVRGIRRGASMEVLSAGFAAVRLLFSLSVTLLTFFGGVVMPPAAFALVHLTWFVIHVGILWRNNVHVNAWRRRFPLAG